MARQRIKTPVGDGGYPKAEEGAGAATQDQFTKDDDGNLLNANGDIVNEDGKPLDKDGNIIEQNPDPDKKGDEGGKDDDPNKKPDDDTSEEEVVDIDGQEYKLDKDGNALDAEGNIFKSKEEMDKMEAASDEGGGDDEDVTLDDLEKLSGIKVDGIESKDFTLDNLAKREKAIKESTEEEAKNTAVQEFFDSNPDLYKAYMYKAQKGSLDGFSNTPYYQSIELDESNEDQLYNMVVEAEVKKGSTPERAKKIANYFKENNELKDAGKESHDFLVDKEKKEFQSFEDKQKQQQKQQIDQEINFYGTYFDENGKEVVVEKEGSVYDKIVNKGQFGNYTIPETGVEINTEKGTKKLSRKDIFDYISKPVKDGLTQAQLDEYNNIKDTDTLLQRYINNLVGNDMNKFVERKALENKSKKIKSRLVSTNSKNKKQGGAKKSGKIVTPVK